MSAPPNQFLMFPVSLDSSQLGFYEHEQSDPSGSTSYQRVLVIPSRNNNQQQQHSRQSATSQTQDSRQPIVPPQPEAQHQNPVPQRAAQAQNVAPFHRSPRPQNRNAQQVRNLNYLRNRERNNRDRQDNRPVNNVAYRRRIQEERRIQNERRLREGRRRPDVWDGVMEVMDGNDSERPGDSSDEVIRLSDDEETLNNGRLRNERNERREGLGIPNRDGERMGQGELMEPITLSDDENEPIPPIVDPRNREIEILEISSDDSDEERLDLESGNENEIEERRGAGNEEDSIGGEQEEREGRRGAQANGGSGDVDGSGVGGALAVGREQPRQQDANHYSFELMLRRQDLTNDYIQMRANWLRGNPSVRTEPATVYIMSFPERHLTVCLDIFTRVHQLDASKFTLVADDDYPFVVERPSRIAHFEVRLTNATDLPRTLLNADWRDLFSYTSLRIKSHFLFHSLSITELLFLTVIAIHIELDPSVRARANVDHRIASSQFNLVLEAYASRHVRGCLAVVLSEPATRRLLEELRTIGWDEEYPDSDLD